MGEWNYAEGDKRQLQTYWVDNGDNQRWELVEVPLVMNFPVQIRSRDRTEGDMCVTLDGRVSGEALKMMPCDDENELQWWSRNLNTGAIWINKKKGDWNLIDLKMGRM